ncbi:MAG: hypothetical protein V3V08_16575 [Nannocystaceae bacterium]
MATPTSTDQLALMVENLVRDYVAQAHAAAVAGRLGAAGHGFRTFSARPPIHKISDTPSHLYHIALANRTSCSPQTLTRAARDFAEKKPEFAVEAGMAALPWLVLGYGYEITGLDVLNAHSHTMKAAENAGCADETRQRIINRVSEEASGERFVTKVLGRQLGFS